MSYSQSRGEAESITSDSWNCLTPIPAQAELFLTHKSSHSSQESKTFFRTHKRSCSGGTTTTPQKISLRNKKDPHLRMCQDLKGVTGESSQAYLSPPIVNPQIVKESTWENIQDSFFYHPKEPSSSLRMSHLPNPERTAPPTPTPVN